MKSNTQTFKTLPSTQLSSLPLLKRSHTDLPGDVFGEKQQNNQVPVHTWLSRPFLLIGVVCVILIGLPITQIQAQHFAWARQVTGKYSNTRIHVMPEGDYVVAGENTGDLKIGPFFNCGAGGTDVFVAFFNGKTDEPYWVKRIAGPSDDKLGDITVVDFHLYISGTFRGQAIVDNFRNNIPDAPCTSYLSETLQSKGGSDAFMVRYYMAKGSLHWATSIGGTNDDEGTGIKVTGSGNFGSLLLTGSFKQAASFHSIDANEDVTNTISIKGDNDGVYRDGFLANYTMTEDALGYPILKIQWAQRVGTGSGDDYGTAVDIDNNGNIYLMGGFTHALNFYSNSYQYWTGLATVSPQNIGYYDMYIAKYTPSGNYLWANQAGGSSIDGGSDLVVDGAGNAYVSGRYHSYNMIFYRNTKAVKTPLISAASGSSGEGFLAKYKPDGVVEWANTVTGNQKDGLTSVVRDKNGNLLVTGYITGSATAYTSKGNQALVSTGGMYEQDLLVISYRPDGGILWKLLGGGKATNAGQFLGVDQNNSVYITGHTGANATFGYHKLGNSGSFVVKVTPPLGKATSRTETESVNEQVREANGLVELQAYPVPASDQATIVFTPAVSEFTSIDLFDLKGSLKATLFKEQAEAGKTYQLSLDVSQYCPGVYLVKVTSAGNASHLKIVVTK